MLTTVDLETGEILSSNGQFALTQFDAARRALQEARSIDELKDIRDKAEALRLYAKQSGEGLEMQNDIAEIKIRAERRAGELLAEMEMNKGAAKEGWKTQSQPATTLEDYGINKTQSSRWQQIAAIPEATFEQHIAETKASGKELTTAGTQQLAKHGNDGYDGNEWYTPAQYIEAARAVLGTIDLDPASCAYAQRTVKATEFYTKEDDGLIHLWRGSVWLNPPYSYPEVANFTAYLTDQYQVGNVRQAILLVNNCTDAEWFQDLLRAYPVCFTNGRVSFERPDRPVFATRQGQAFFYLGNDLERFANTFAQYGTLVKCIAR